MWSFLNVKDYVECTAQGMCVVLSVAWNVPCVVEVGAAVVESHSIAYAPSEVEWSPYFGFKSSHHFCPLCTAFHTSEMKWGDGAINGINDVRSVDVVLEGSKGVTQTYENTVPALHVFCHIVVHSKTKIRSVDFIVELGRFVGMVTCAPSHFNGWEETPLHIESCCCFILSVGGGKGHNSSCYINRNTDSCHKRHLFGCEESSCSFLAGCKLHAFHLFRTSVMGGVSSGGCALLLC